MATPPEPIYEENTFLTIRRRTLCATVFVTFTVAVARDSFFS